MKFEHGMSFCEVLTPIARCLRERGASPLYSFYFSLSPDPLCFSRMKLLLVGHRVV